MTEIKQKTPNFDDRSIYLTKAAKKSIAVYITSNTRHRQVLCPEHKVGTSGNRNEPQPDKKGSHSCLPFPHPRYLASCQHRYMLNQLHESVYLP